MAVDVETSIEIERPRAEVAAYAIDPETATEWYANIGSIEWKTPPPVAEGSQVAFVARFLGRTLTYTYKIDRFVPNELLVMSTSEGPFAMETTYRFEDSPSGGTVMRLRNRGEPSGFSRVAAPMIARAMERANRKDLARLKELLEGNRVAETG